MQLNDQQLRQVYQMVDNIPFSRGKKNITRDFSDGVMMAELVHYYRPKVVELHSYSAASSVVKKIANWETLNGKVLKKLGIGLGRKQIEDIVNCAPMVIQSYLYSVLQRFQSPGQQVNLRTQLKKVQPISPSRPKNSNNFQLPQNTSPGVGNSTMTFQDRTQNQGQNQNQNQSQAQNQNQNQNPRNMMFSKETDQVFQLVEEIEEAYQRLLKLQEKSKLKDQYIKNLEKKVQKMIFS